MIELLYNINDLSRLIEDTEEEYSEEGKASQGMHVDISNGSMIELEQRIDHEIFDGLQIFIVLNQDENGRCVPIYEIKLVDDSGSIDDILTDAEIEEIANQACDLLT